MFSTRNSLTQITRGSAVRWAMLGAAALGAIGCSTAPRPLELSQTTLIVDPAMQKRDWDRSVAYYPSGAVPAWDTRFWYKPPAGSPQAIKPITEPIAFVGQTLFLPIALIEAPPFKPVIAHGVQEPVTSTAFPAPPGNLSPSSANQTSGSAAAAAH
jgi:hypothetical protein